MLCNETMLSNICMKEAVKCPKVIVPSAGRRRKRSLPRCTPGSSAGNGVGAPSTTPNPQDPQCSRPILHPAESKPENTLEYAFNPEWRKDYNFLIEEARIDYDASFGKMDMNRSYNNLFEILWYTQIPCFDVKQVTSTQQNQNGMIKSCTWRGMKLPCSKLFTASPTDRGMCCSFNVKAAEEMFAAGVYQTNIIKMQKRDDLLAFDKNEGDTIPKDGNQTKLIKKGNDDKSAHNETIDMIDSDRKFKPQAGVSKGLSLVLDAHSDLLSSSSIGDNFQGFIAVVNENNQFPITTERSFLIKPGHDNMIAMGAAKVSAEPNIKRYPAEKRYCYFPDENIGHLHKSYSQANCKLECQIGATLKLLKAKNRTTCMPWYYPITGMEYPLCDPWDALQFREQMQNIPDDSCNACLPDCNHTEIQASVSAAPFRRCDYKNVGISSLCSLETKGAPSPPKWGQNVLTEYKSRSAVGDVPPYVTNQVKNNRRKLVSAEHEMKEIFAATNKQDGATYDAYETDVARVTFFFESSNAYEFCRRCRMTMIDYISQVGGLLGLCIGFSLISAVEVFYWFTFRLYRNLQTI